MSTPSNITYSVATIPDLIAITGAFDGQVVFVLGYFNKNDGGGGEFYWAAGSSTADDGGSVIAPTGALTGRWKRIFPESIVNLKWFGAGFNNSTDTQQIQNAITYAFGVQFDLIFAPAGTYQITDNIFLYGSISMYGVKSGTKFVLQGSFNGTSYPVLVTDHGYSVFCMGIRSTAGVVTPWKDAFLKDISFSATSDAMFYICINTYNVNDVKFDNLHFDFTSLPADHVLGTAIEGLNNLNFCTSSSRQLVKVYDSQVYHKQNSIGNEGIAQTNCDGFEASGNYIFGLGDDAIAAHHCTNVVIKNNRCYTTDARIYVSNSQNVLIDGNYMERIVNQSTGTWNSGGGLLYLDLEGSDTPNTNVTIVNNTFYLPEGPTTVNSTYILRAIGVQGLVCSNNIFRSLAVSANGSAVAVAAISIEATNATHAGNQVISNNVCIGKYLNTIREVAPISTDIAGPSSYLGNPAEDLDYSLIGPDSQIVDFFRKRGTATFSGDGATVVFNIAHNLAVVPTFYNAVGISNAAAGISYITANSTNITVNYATAPPAGTNNVQILWIANNDLI